MDERLLRELFHGAPTPTPTPSPLRTVQDYQNELGMSRGGMPSAMPTPMVPPTALERVFAGVSDEEERKSHSKRAQAETSLMTKRGQAVDAQMRMIQDRLGALRSRSNANDEDTFVAGPTQGYVRGGARKGQSKGTFSRSNKPIASYGEDELSAEDAAGFGVPKAMADIIERIGSAKSPQQLKALEILSQSIPERQTPQQEDEMLLKEVMKVKDPLGAMTIAQAILRRRGRSDEYIDALFNGADVLKPK